jgi:hypothetical protein
MKVIWRETGRDGSRSVTEVDYATGRKKAVLYRRPQRLGEHGYWQLSTSCGVPLRQLRQAQKVDAELGVSIDYVKRGPVALAGFRSPSEKRAWLRRHRWVDHDACYRDPCPGDFTENR